MDRDDDIEQDPEPGPDETDGYLEEDQAPAEPAKPAADTDVPYRTVEASIALAGTPPTGELVLGEFAGSIIGVEDDEGTRLEFSAEEVGVGATRLRVVGGTKGDTAVRILVVA